VYLIYDEQRDGLHVVPSLPAATDSIPLLRCRYDEVGLCHRLHVRRHVTRQLHHSEELNQERQYKIYTFYDNPQASSILWISVFFLTKEIKLNKEKNTEKT